MNIRTRITVIFFAIVIIVVSVISVSIYYFSSEYRQQDFYRRLNSRATNTAKLLIDFEEVDAALLQRMERQNPANLPSQHVVIYNYKNEIVYQGEGALPVSIDTTLLNRVRLEGEVRFKHNDFQVLGFLFADKFDRFTVVAAATDTNGLDALDNLRNILITTFFLSFIVVSIVGWFFASRVVAPISKIVHEVDNITEKKLDQRLDERGGSDELAKLAMTFNKMIGRLQTAFVSQRNFIANASHEIKTPITVIAGEIEVTLLQRRTPEYYEKVLRSALAGVRGMNRLSTQLLLLAQTSSENPVKNFSPVHIDDIIWSVRDELSKANPTFNVNVNFDISISDNAVIMDGDEGLLRVVFHNLIENGCKYSEDKTVHVTLRATDEDIRMVFFNNGPGIIDNDRVLIFEPFYRGKSKGKAKGFGIGLPLSKKIVDLHNGVISVESVLNTRTTFYLVLPKHQK